MLFNNTLYFTCRYVWTGLFLGREDGLQFQFLFDVLLPKLNNQWLGRKEMFYLTMHLTISALLLYQYILWNFVIFHNHKEISEV